MAAEGREPPALRPHFPAMCGASFSFSQKEDGHQSGSWSTLRGNLCPAAIFEKVAGMGVSENPLAPASGSHKPERSGLPSAVRGARAERFGLPSFVRGTAGVG